MIQNASAPPPARIGMKLRTIAMRRFSVMSNSGFLLYFLARSVTCLLSAMYSKTKRKMPMPAPTRAPWSAGCMPRILAWVEQYCLTFGAPGRLVRARDGLEVGDAGRPVVDPFAQLRAAVDEVDREPPALILVFEVAPERVIGPQRPQRLEG